MYEPQLWMDAAIYPFLVRWGLSTGYEVKTNQDHTLLYDLVNLDAIRCRELIAEDKPTRLSREEAVELVKSFSKTTLSDYDPHYSPQVRLDEDMYDHHFMPYMKEEHYFVNASHKGIFWDVLQVFETEEEACTTGRPHVVAVTMCRSEVTSVVRDLEYHRVMIPYMVKCRMGPTTKMWQKEIETFEQAEAVLEREKPRHVPTADWRIYGDMTAVLRHLKAGEEDLPEDLVTTDDWLWLTMWYPGKHGADCLSQGFYDNLTELRLDMIEVEDQYIHVVTGIYACLRHDAPPVEEKAPGPKWRVIAGSSARPEDTESELAGGIAVIWTKVVLSVGKGEQEIKILATSDPKEIDAADLAALNEAIRSDITWVQEVDHAMLFPYYRALKMKGAVEYERFEIDEDNHWLPKESKAK